MKFETSKRIDRWCEDHRKSGCISHATAGEQFVFEFLPSGIVECQTVKCLCCGKEFTDYVDQGKTDMQELEKILEEIKDELKDIYLDIANNYNISDLQYDGDKVACVASKFRCDAGRRIEKIIRKHMSDNDINASHKCGECNRRKWYQKGYKDGKKNDGWISVEERLPTREECEKDNNEFLVQTATGERFSFEYDPLANGFDNPLWCCNVPVVAWQPLPETYRPERSEE